MPRYHFHTKDGSACPDPQGTELPDLNAAKAQATQYLAEMLRDNPRLIWDTQDFNMTVTDDDGLTLFTLDLTANISAAVNMAEPAGADAKVGTR